MWISLFILFQLSFFNDYKNQYENFLKNKEMCNYLEKKLEDTGKQIELYIKNKEVLKAKKLLKENHNLSIQYTNCKKEQKIKEKELRKLLPKAKIELENEVKKTLTSNISSKEKTEKLYPLIEKLKFLKEENVCPIVNFKRIEIERDEPLEILKEKAESIKLILSDIKNEEKKAEGKIEELKKEKMLRQNVQQFLKTIEVEGGGALLDVKISSEEMIYDLEKLDEEIENCEKAIIIYKSFLNYWEEVLNSLKEKGIKEF